MNNLFAILPSVAPPFPPDPSNDSLPLWAQIVAGSVCMVLFVTSGYKLFRRIVPSASVARPPGARLHEWASFLYSNKTRERVFDPMLADMREEYFEALAKGRKWKARWEVLKYYGQFARVIPFHALVAIGKQIVEIWKLFGTVR